MVAERTQIGHECICRPLLSAGESCFCLDDRPVTALTKQDTILQKEHVYLYEQRNFFAEDVKRSLTFRGGFVLVLDKFKTQFEINKITFSPDVLIFSLKSDVFTDVNNWSKIASVSPIHMPVFAREYLEQKHPFLPKRKIESLVNLWLARY